MYFKLFRETDITDLEVKIDKNKLYREDEYTKKRA